MEFQLGRWILGFVVVVAALHSHRYTHNRPSRGSSVPC